MKLKDYFLILFMEESSEVIKSASKVIRYGQNYIFPKYRDVTTEDSLNSEFADCLASIIILNSLGISVTPNTVESLLKDEYIFNEMEYRIRNILAITEDNLAKLELDRKEFKNFKESLMNKLAKAKEYLANKVYEKNSRKILSKLF